jgi:hypothetical protein
MKDARKGTVGDNPRSAPEDLARPQLTTIAKLVSRHDGFSAGGLRHLLFYRGQDLEREGIVIRLGSRILIDENRFLDWLRAGQARTIVGVGR